MNRANTFIPAFIAAGLGIANGLWIFGPAFEEQARERDEKTRAQIEGQKPLGEEVIASIKVAGDTSRSAATASALGNTSSWKSKLGLWEKPSDNSSRTKEEFEASERDQKPEGSSKV